MLDETTYLMDWYILDFSLAGKEAKAMLFYMHELKQTNTCTVMQSFMVFSQNLWAVGTHFEKAFTVVMGQTLYMLSAVKQFKSCILSWIM